MSSQEVVEAITAGTTYAPNFGERVAPHLVYDERLGFLALPNLASGEQTVQLMLGFIPIEPGGEAPARLRSATRLADVPRAHRSIRQQARGVGLRISNTWQSASNELPAADHFGVYATSVNRRLLLDCRNPRTLDRLQRAGDIAMRGVRTLAGGLATLAEVVDTVHVSYGNAESVLFDQPPEAGFRPWRRRETSPVPPEYMVIRSAGMVLHRVGIVDRSTPQNN